MHRLLFFFVFACFLQSGFAQNAGALDASFGANGIVNTAFTNASDCQAIALQADGKIVMAGQYISGGFTQIALTRYNVNGSLDNTFGTAGKSIIALATSNANVKAAAISNGKILLAGAIDDKPSLIRLLSNGQVDPSFGANGILSFTATMPGILDMKVLSDGKIVGCGLANPGSGNQVGVFRRNADGSADNSFGSAGFSSKGLNTSLITTTRMAVQTDGKLVVTGTALNGNTQYDVMLVRFNADGAIDSGFGTNGVVLASFGAGGAYDQANGIAVQTDGKIVVCGRIANVTPTVMLVARFNANGTKDSSFGTNGGTSVNFNSNFDEGRSVAIQQDGKIVACGYSLSGSNRLMALARLNTNGSLDNSFGTSGKTTTMIGTKVWTEQILLQSDGKILAGGYSDVSNLRQFALARFNSGLVTAAYTPNTLIPGFSVFPNPAISGSKVNVRFNLLASEEPFLQIVSADGRMLSAQHLGRFGAGEQQLEIEIPANIPPNTLCFFYLKAGNSAAVQQVLVRK